MFQIDHYITAAGGVDVFERWIDTLRVGKVVVLLLCGGDKKSQSKDIEDAKACLQGYKTRRKEAAAPKRST